MKSKIIVGSLVKFCETELPDGTLNPPVGVSLDDFLLTVEMTPGGDCIGIVTAEDFVEGEIVYQVLVNERKLWFNSDSVFPLDWVDT